jgi:hypothetical protein
MGDLDRVRRRADEFARLLDDGTQHVPSAAEDPEFGDALVLVSQLRSAGAVHPSPDFTATLRERLVDEAAGRVTTLPVDTQEPSDDADTEQSEESATTPVVSGSRRRRGRLIAGAAAFVVVVGGIGSAAAAQESVEGDTLYALKRGLEAVATKVSVSDDSRGRRELSHALNRLTEAERLVDDRAEAAPVSKTLGDFSTQARNGANHLLASFETDNEASSVESIYVFTDEARARLTALSAKVPEGAKPAHAGALALVDQLALRARETCPTCISPKTTSTVEPSIDATTEQQTPSEPSALPTGQPTQVPTMVPSRPDNTPVPTLTKPSVPVTSKSSVPPGTNEPTLEPSLPPILPSISLPLPTITLPSLQPLLPSVPLLPEN